MSLSRPSMRSRTARNACVEAPPQSLVPPNCSRRVTPGTQDNGLVEAEGDQMSAVGHLMDLVLSAHRTFVIHVIVLFGSQLAAQGFSKNPGTGTQKYVFRCCRGPIMLSNVL